jgi:hypothetical protein
MAIRPIAHPAIQTKGARAFHCPVAKPDSLHMSVDMNPFGDSFTHIPRMPWIGTRKKGVSVNQKGDGNNPAAL